MTVLSGWENFYVIIGSSSGALIGLQFVAMSLIADLPIGQDGAQASAAFATPTIVHFAAVLLLSAVLCAPWNVIGGAAIFWGLAGLVGIVYQIIVAGRLRAQTAYRPDFEDWLFHLVLPFLAYGVLASSAFAAPFHAFAALFVVAAAVLLLLFIGIHNTWDAVTYHIYVSRRKHQAGRTPP